VGFHHLASNQLKVYSLDDFWTFTQLVQISEVAGSLTIILAFFRVLHCFTLIEYLGIGILIITIFKMFVDIIMKFTRVVQNER